MAIFNLNEARENNTGRRCIMVERVATRNELIRMAQEAEDKYFLTGDPHYKMVALQLRDELAAGRKQYRINI